MKTIQKASCVLRRIAIAGLCAASLWTASLAHAAIAPSAPAVLGDLHAAVRAPVSADALPAPFLVAPTCGGCGRTGTAANFRAAPASLRIVVAGGGPTTVRDSRRPLPPLRG